MTVPAQPKIYHIAHIDRLPSIIANNRLWSDAEVNARNPQGTVIGMDSIKQRRLTLPLSSRAGLNVGDCVPFYFCPRSIMLYLIHQANHPELTYRGGQTPIIHLQADLHNVVNWANQQKRRWAFTTSNAGSYYFEDRCDLNQLNEIDWQSVQTHHWQNCKEGKQAEFLLEQFFPWELIEKIGVVSNVTYQQVMNAIPSNGHRPNVVIEEQWYY
jgi:ssDNA thymidine ADP-ribosyltransferase, DarT